MNRKQRKENRKQTKGQIIIVSVFVLVIVAILGMVAVTMISSESFSVVKNLHGIQALNIAEAGVRFTIATSLAADSDWSDNSDFGPVSLNPGYFTVHYASKAKRICILEVTGTVNGVNRTVRLTVKRGGAFPYQFLEYGLYGGDPSSIGDRVRFYNDSKIIGSFYYYGPVEIMGSRPPPCQTDGVIRSYSIDPPPSVGIPNYYASWEAISTVDPIVWDNTYYDNWLTVAASNAATSLSLSGNQTLNLNGQTRWYRAITMKNFSRIIGPGTICATAMPTGSGDLNMSDSSRIIGPVRVVVRGSAKMNNDSYLFGTVEVIARQKFDINHNCFTSRECTLYSKGDFTLNNDAIARGNVLAPYGKITLYTNSQIKGLIYANEFQAYDRATLEGGAAFKEVGNFYNRSMVIQNGGVLPSFLPPGISSEGTTDSFEVSDWGEVY
ncbi:MAG: hypothetical protein ABIK67_07955 [candidate division WOR-3 bacterium]